MHPGAAADRAEIRRMLNSEAPQWLKDIAQATLDWADDISRLRAAPLVPWALPLLQPQLPPGNGQPNDPCSCCGGSGGHAPWCFAEFERVHAGPYTLTWLTAWPHWPIRIVPTERR